MVFEARICALTVLVSLVIASCGAFETQRQPSDTLAATPRPSLVGEPSPSPIGMVTILDTLDATDVPEGNQRTELVDLPAAEIGGFCFAPGSDDPLFALQFAKSRGEAEPRHDMSIFRAPVDADGQPTGEVLRFADLLARHNPLPGPAFISGIACSDASGEVLVQLRNAEYLLHDTDWVSALWRLDAQGRSVAHASLPIGPIFADLDPWGYVWAPDGRHVLLEDAVGAVHLVDLPERGSTSRSTLGLGINLYSPAGAGNGTMLWSPDGGQITLQSASIGSSEVWAIDADALLETGVATPVRTQIDEEVSLVRGVPAGRIEVAIEKLDDRGRPMREIELWSASYGSGPEGTFDEPRQLGALRLSEPSHSGRIEVWRIAERRFALLRGGRLFLVELPASDETARLWRVSREADFVAEMLWSEERRALLYRVRKDARDLAAYPGADTDRLDVPGQLRVLRLDEARLDAVFSQESSESGLPGGWVTHVDAVAGWAIDLPPDWRFQASGWPGGDTTIVQSFAPDGIGVDGIPTEKIKIDVFPVDTYSGGLEGLVAHIDRSADPIVEPSVLTRERWSLSAGLPALRRELAGDSAGPVHQLIFALDGRGYQALGWGDGTAFDAVMRTLRPWPLRR